MCGCVVCYVCRCVVVLCVVVLCVTCVGVWLCCVTCVVVLRVWADIFTQGLNWVVVVLFSQGGACM